MRITVGNAVFAPSRPGAGDRRCPVTGAAIKHTGVFRLGLILTLVAACLSGCTRDPNVRKQKYLESGERYFEKGQYAEAAIQFKNAVQIDSGFADAHYRMAQALLKLQQWGPAYQELGRTIELQPENYQARIDLANLVIAGRDFKQAKEQTDLLLDKQPNNPQVHIALANLQIGQENLPGAMQEMQKAIALDPGSWEPYLDLALIQTRADLPDAAEVNFKKAAELNPKGVQAQLALGGYYQSRSRFPEAEEQFRRAMELDPKDPDPPAALARLYVSEGKNAQAEDFLKQAKARFPDNSTGYRMLGDFYFATGDLDKAAAEYAVIYHDHPKDIQVKKNYIQLLILKSRVDEARKLNDEILAIAPNDSEGLIYRGQIQLRDGHASDAAQTLQNALKNDPGNAVAHYHLGLALDQLGNPARALDEWRAAVRLRPDLVDAQRALANAAVRSGDMNAMEQAATQIINQQPGSPDGYAMRALSKINRQQFSAAAEDVKKAIDVAPQRAIGYIQLGNLNLVQKQYSKAGEAYQQALDRDPNSNDALSGLMNSYLAGKQTDKAIAAANAQITKSPNNSAFYDLLGTVLFNSKKDLDGAEAAFTKAAALDKNNADALLKLGQVQVAKGSADKAIATYQQSLKDNPREPSFYTLMGELYESKQDWGNAKDSYQKALELKPEDPLASNNLAYVMLQSGGNVDVALGFARTARRGMPDSPAAADTLGWVLYQKGAYQSAVDLFKESLKLAEKSKEPDDPNVHYHLGLAYEKTGQNDLARQHLERVLKLNPNYSDAAEVKKQLAQLQS
jgi:tetratricopeptide (TPR) repeat protein